MFSSAYYTLVLDYTREEEGDSVSWYTDVSQEGNYAFLLVEATVCCQLCRASTL